MTWFKAKLNLNAYLLLLLFVFMVQGSFVRLPIYLVKGFSYVDLFAVILGAILIISQKTYFNCNLYKTSLLIFVFLPIIVDITHVIFNNIALVDALASFKRLYFLYLFILFEKYAVFFTKNVQYFFNFALLGTVIGCIMYFFLDYSYSLAANTQIIISNIVLLNDMNVIGQVLALGLLSLALLFLSTSNNVYLFFILLFSYPVFLTYSKAAILQYLITLLFVFSIVSFKKKLLILMFVCIACLSLNYNNRLGDFLSVVDFKTTQSTYSTEIRKDYIAITLFSSFDNLLGHGTGRFYHIQEDSSKNLIEKGDNSHNAFAEIFYNYGFLSILSFTYFFFVSIFNISKASLPATRPSILQNYLILYVGAIIIVYASVQLQIYSQPWFYCISGLSSSLLTRKINVAIDSSSV